MGEREEEGREGEEGEEREVRKERRERRGEEEEEDNHVFPLLIENTIKYTQTNKQTNKQMLRVESGLGTTADLLLVAVGSQCMSSKSLRHLEAGGYCPPCVWVCVCVCGGGVRSWICV